MMKRWMTILLAACLLSGVLMFSASALDEQESQWQSVEEFEQYALANWVRPVHGAIQPIEDGREFGGVRDGGRLHAAIDFLRPISMGSGYGTPVYAMAGGTVIDYMPYYYGATDAVAIQHADGSIARYCEISTHLREGDTVVQGQRIGTMIYGYGLCMLHLELFLGTSKAEGSIGAVSKNPDGSSNEYYKYVSDVGGSYHRRSDLLDPTFLLDITREPEQLFTDVAEDAYYYDAVLWAVNSGVASSETDTEFAPEENCLRAQMVTFIWHAAGSPEPKRTDNPFVDVFPDDDCYKAMLWAYENNVASGTSGTTFDPKAVVNRDQAVTLLWRAAGFPEPERTDDRFEDVPSDSYYYKAVLWAVENGVTSGTSGTTFSPERPCTRGEIVTFLHRCT